MSTDDPHLERVRPRGPLVGVGRVPGSKSIAQRLLVWSAAAEGASELVGVTPSGDVDSAVDALRALGARVAVAHERILIEPAPAFVFVQRAVEPALDQRVVPVGESATLARLALALVATRAGPITRLAPTGSLTRRAPTSLVAALRGLGATIDGHGYALDVRGVAATSPWRLRRPTSSQDVSGLLGALAANGGGELVVEGAVPSLPYVELSIAVLGWFGVRVTRTPTGWRVAGRLVAPSAPVLVEPDASAAAVLLAAAAVTGGDVRVPGLGADSPQGDVRMIEHLAAFGVDARRSRHELSARGLPSRGAVLQLAGEPDLAPLLTVVAARAALDHGVTSELHGLGTLRGKESDRLAALAALLDDLGFEGRVDDATLRIGPGTPRRPSAPLDPSGDHRIAFAGALFGTFLDGIDVLEPECVSKSWPEFWTALAALAPRRGLH